MARSRVSAFLKIIRDHEAKGSENPYLELHWDGKRHISFSDFSAHPYANGENKPAGAYQIKKETFNDVVKATGWPTRYAAFDQDRVAIYLLQARSKPDSEPRRSALGYIMEGEIEQAVNDTKLWKLFAFLPGRGKQQQLTLDQLNQLFNAYLVEHLK